MRKLKENRKKGFTLVELIVVLVILAILAALLVPALTGYIDKAKEKQIIAETRQAVMAAQTIADEAYAEGKNDTTNASDLNTDAGLADGTSELKKLADVPSGSTIDSIEVTGGKITKLAYARSNKKYEYSIDATTGSGKYDPK